MLVIPSYFPHLMERRIREFELSGTHWTQEMIAHNVDTEVVRVPLAARSPMIESRPSLSTTMRRQGTRR